MRKWWKIPLLTLLVFVLTVPFVYGEWGAKAEGAVNEDDFKLYYNAIEKYTGSEKNLVIPETIKGTKIRSINAEAFMNNEFIETVEIPGNVNILAGAFKGCRNLKKVIIHKGDENVNLVNNVFAGTAYGLELSIPSNVRLGQNALNGSSLGNFILTSGMLSDSGFQDAFGDASIQKLTINIDPDNAFLDRLDQLIRDHTIKVNENEIYFNIPANTSITELTLNKETIQTTAGAAAQQLKLSNAYPNVSSVFMKDSNTTWETLEGLTWTSSAPSVAAVGNDGKVTPLADGIATITASYNGMTASCRVQVGDPDYEFDETTGTIIRYLGSDAEVTIPGTLYGTEVKKLGERAFSEAKELTKVILPDSVTEIGAYAFTPADGEDGSAKFSSKLEEVVLPSGLSSLGKGAFQNTAVKAVDVPAALAEVGTKAFNNCVGLKSVSMKKGTKKIGESAFDKCSGLTSLTLPEGLQEIGNFAFRNCTSLPDLKLPNSVQKIGNSAFNFCVKFTEVEIPESVTSLGDNVFEFIPNLTTAVLPESLHKIPAGLFKRCAKLEKVTFSKNIEEIGEEAFSGCTGLRGKEIIIPNNLKTALPNSAFAGINGTEGNIGLKILYRGEKDASNNPVIRHKMFGSYDEKIVGYILAVDTDMEPRLNHTEIKDWKITDSPVQLTAEAYPVNLPEEMKEDNVEKEPADVQWRSTNAAVASVSDSGLVTPVSAGTADIYAALNGKETACKVTVDGGKITVTAPDMPLDDETQAILAGTEPIKTSLAAGKDVTVMMKMEITESDALDEAAAASFSEAAGDDWEISSYYNVTIQALIDGTVKIVEETVSPLELSFPVTGSPDSCKIARLHKGVVDILDAQLTGDGKAVVNSGKFSIYAVLSPRQASDNPVTDPPLNDPENPDDPDIDKGQDDNLNSDDGRGEDGGTGVNDGTNTQDGSVTDKNTGINGKTQTEQVNLRKTVKIQNKVKAAGSSQVSTGDSANMTPLIIAAVCALLILVGAAIWLVWKRRR